MNTTVTRTNVYPPRGPRDAMLTTAGSYTPRSQRIMARALEDVINAMTTSPLPTVHASITPNPQPGTPGRVDVTLTITTTKQHPQDWAHEALYGVPLRSAWELAAHRARTLATPGPRYDRQALLRRAGLAKHPRYRGNHHNAAA